MHYKYKIELDGEIIDFNNEKASKLITSMWLRLYEKYKYNPKIFPQ